MIDVIETKAAIEEENDRIAKNVRAFLLEHGTVLINVMSSPGAGKTATLLRTAGILKDEFRIGVIEADVDSDVDAQAMAEAGLAAVQLHTGGSCHMDSTMTLEALRGLGEPCPDVVFLENIGNLVCPAEFDVGADLNVMILSVPEGDDKPLKYPLMFQVSDCLLINKTDTAAIFDFSLERCEAYVRDLNPDMKIFPLSAKSGTGFDAWTAFLAEKIRQIRTEKSRSSRETEGDAI